MTPITNHPAVRYMGDGRWALTDPLTYWSQYGKIVVPTDFETDLDSIPRLPLAYLLTKNASVTGAVVHDYLYVVGKIGDRDITREQADNVMSEIMKEEGVPWWQRALITTGLKVGGWIAWNRHRENDDEPDFV